MRRRVHTVLAVLSWCWTAVAGAGAATHLDNVTVGYASFSGHYTPMWIAVEDALGKKYGIDLKAVYADRMRPQQLLMSGDVPIVIATGSGALTSHIVGAKDQVIVANFINKVGGAIYSKPEIKTPEDLRGKTIGVGRAGSISDSVIRYVLRKVRVGSRPPLLQVIRSGLDILSLQYPQAKQTDTIAIFDASFVRRLDQSGFIAGLGRK